MKICSNCNKEFDDEFNFCPFCGSQYGKIECPNCHKLLNKASPFCGYCGHELSVKESDIKENNAKPNLQNIYNLIMKISLIILSSLFLIAIFCPFFTVSYQATNYLPLSDNISIFSFYSSDYFDFIDQGNNILFADSIINLIIISISIICTISFSIFSIIKNSISLVKKDDKIDYSFSLLSSTFYFCTMFISGFCTIGLVNETVSNQIMMSSSIGIFPLILIILICLIIISKFVLKICLVDRKINTRTLIINLFSIISYILNIIIIILLVGPLITIKNTSGVANMPAFLSLISMQEANVSQNCINKLIICYSFNLVIIILNIINLPFNPRNNSKHTLANLIITSLSFLLSVLFIIITGTTIIDLCQYIVKGSKVFVASNIIACLILQFITLGLSITKFVIIKKIN